MASNIDRVNMLEDDSTMRIYPTINDLCIYIDPDGNIWGECDYGQSYRGVDHNYLLFSTDTWEIFFEDEGCIIVPENREIYGLWNNLTNAQRTTIQEAEGYGYKFVEVDDEDTEDEDDEGEEV